jgi:hypothetical protein
VWRRSKGLDTAVIALGEERMETADRADIHDWTTRS